MQEQNAAGGQGIEVRRPRSARVVAAQVIGARSVKGYEQYVGVARRGGDGFGFVMPAT